MRTSLPDRSPPAPMEQPATQELEDLLDQLHVALGDMRIYGPRHRMTLRRTAEASRKLDEVLSAFGTLRLVSSLDGLSWEGLVVRPESDDKEGIGRLLHREGIRAITLHQGVDQGELRALLETLRLNLSLPEYEEETLESLLWQVGFQFVEVEALTELRDAEVLSGELWRRGDADAAGEVIRQLLSLRVDGDAAPRKLDGQVSEAALHRAVAESDLSGLGGGDAAYQLEDRARWLRQLNPPGSEDHGDLARERDAIRSDDPGRLLSAMVLLLMRVALEDREELTAEEALALAGTAADELFRRGLPGGVLSLVEGAPGVLRAAPPEAMGRLGLLLSFTEGLCSPDRVIKMILGIDPAHLEDRDGFRALVAWLPESALERLLETVGRQLTGEQRAGLLGLLAEVAGERFERWLGEIDRQPAPRIVAMVQLLRGLDGGPGKATRFRLVGHPAHEVRVAALEWYLDDLPGEDVDRLLPLMLDRQVEVRRAARDVLARHRPPKAYSWLRGQVSGDGFALLEPGLKRDLCVALGIVGGDLGLEPLMALFEKKVPVFGGRDASADLLAASMGLAASGTVQARLALEKGASSLNRSRRAACQEALRHFGRFR